MKYGSRKKMILKMNRTLHSNNNFKEITKILIKDHNNFNREISITKTNTAQTKIITLINLKHLQIDKDNNNSLINQNNKNLNKKKNNTKKK